MNLHVTGFQALKLIEAGEEGDGSPHPQVSLGEEFMAEQDPLDDEEEELSEFECLMLDITHIITCFYKFSIAIQNPAPKERLHKIVLIDVSYFEHWDIKHVDEKLCPVDPQNNFRVAKYLCERLGKANTRRRQLLKYYKDHHKTISKYIDDPSSLRSAIEANTLTHTSIPTMEDSSPVGIPGPKRAATIHTMTKSQTTVSTVKVELIQANNIEQDEDQLSQTSFATSADHKISIRIPSPPNEVAAFEGKPFECPYCFNIIKIRNRQDWKYVGNSARYFYSILNIFLGSMYLRIFNLMSAHPSTAPKQSSYMEASTSGLIMRYSFTGESGIVIPA